MKLKPASPKEGFEMATGKTYIHTLTTGELKAILKALSVCTNPEDDFSDRLQIETEPGLGLLTLYTGNGARFARATVACETIEKARKLCVRFSAVAGFVGIEDTEKDAFDNKDATIILDIRDGELVLYGQGAAARRSLKIPARTDELLLPAWGYSMEDFRFSLESAKGFAVKLDAVARAAYPGEERAALNGVCLRYNGNGETLTLCACDGRQAAEFETAYDEDDSNLPDKNGKCDALLALPHVAALKNALKVADGKSGLEVAMRDLAETPELKVKSVEEAGEEKPETGDGRPVDTGFLPEGKNISAKRQDAASPENSRRDACFPLRVEFEFRTKGMTQVALMLPVSTAKFPDLEPLFEKYTKCPGTSVTRVDSEVLAGMLEQMQKVLCQKNMSAKLDFSKFPKKPEIYLSEARGEYEAVVPATDILQNEIPEEARDSRFNPELLAGALAAFGGGDVCLCFNENAPKQVMLTQPDDERRPLVSKHRRTLMGQERA